MLTTYGKKFSEAKKSPLDVMLLLYLNCSLNLGRGGHRENMGERKLLVSMWRILHCFYFSKGQLFIRNVNYFEML